MPRLILLALVGLAAAAQTRVDLRTQAKTVDFSGATSTKPMKVGTSLPAQCLAGEMFFRTDAPEGANLYGCTETDVWAVQGGITTENCWYDSTDQMLKCQDTGGNIRTMVKSSAPGVANQWVDYITPSGVPHTSQPTAAAVGAVADPGANGIPYRGSLGVSQPANADQLSKPFSCQDAGAGNTYACDLNPPITTYTVGTSYWFKANAANTGASTVNFNRLGTRPILKQSDLQLISGDIKAGQWVMVTYDGAAMQMQSQTANPASGAVASVFGRTGPIAAQAGDYTTAQVTESGNLYFTNTRAQQAFSFPGAIRLSSGALDCPTCITTATQPDTDLSGTFPHLSVVKLQGRQVASTPPSNLQYLGWNTTLSQWEPKTIPSPPITSIFGRTGAIASQNGDYSFSQIGGTIATAQLPAVTMRTDQSNTATAGTHDFSGADHTLPMKSGTLADIPATCRIGETYFATDESAGNNLFGCTSADQWTVQGAATAVQSESVAIGSRATTNYMTGPGLMSVISDTGSEIEVLWALDTAVVQTQQGEQSGAALYCVSGSGSSTAYQCSLNPAALEYAPGMVLHWKPDVDGAGGPTTLDVDSLGARPVKLADGTGDPGITDIAVGRLYQIWYDGQAFRLPPNLASGISDPGQNGILYRSAYGTAARANADQMSGPSSCQDAGADANYACDLDPAIATYSAGTAYWFRANTANAGPATVNFNSLGAKSIKKQADQDLAAGDIRAGQWVMLTYDGTNMQMLSQAPTAAGSGSVSSVFGRTGIVAAAAGDYTTAQVTESGNLYFTPARALAAVTWSTLTGKPSTYAPSAHAASHQAGGSDEIATATPAANAIPKAGASGKLAGDWLPSPAASSLGGVRAIDCSGTGYVQKINADGSVSCAAPAGGGGSIKTAIVFDGATGTLADGSSVSWSCGSGSAAQCTAVWTVPDGVTWVRSVVWSGGGGGNGSVVASRSNAGGGGGGYADVMCPVTPGSTVSVAVGLGGAGGTAGGGAGGAGGDSRFASCVTVKGAPVYTSSVNNAPVGGGIAGSPQIWLNAAGTGLLTWSASSTPCAFGGTVATGQVLRMDQGGCGATGLSSTNGPGHDGGSAIGGGGGGGNGAYNSDTYGNGGTSTLGGAGGRGGAHTAATGLTPCAAGAVPGGGGGSAAAAASGSSYAGCAGARGEIRIYY